MGNIGCNGNLCVAFWLGVVVMKNTIICGIIGLFMLASICFACYKMGKNQVKVEVITKEIEVIKYVERKKASIQARPNAARSDLLKLMHEGQL